MVGRNESYTRQDVEKLLYMIETSTMEMWRDRSDGLSVQERHHDWIEVTARLKKATGRDHMDDVSVRNKWFHLKRKALGAQQTNQPLTAVRI